MARTPEQKARRAELARERYKDPEYRAHRNKRNQDPKRKAAERLRWYAKSIKYKYALSAEEHESMIGQQNGLCLICKRRRKLVVDHCHETGAVRGLLCTPCNTGIGFLGDTLTSVLRAVRYLRDAKKRQQLPLFKDDSKA